MKKLTICTCSSRTFINRENAARLAALAQMSGWEVTLVADLCELAAENGAGASEILSGATIAACHERAVSALCDFCGSVPTAILNLRADTLEKMTAKLGINGTVSEEEAVLRYKQEMDAFPPKQGSDAWYPVIEKGACIECGKCLDFCPFGVYEKSGDTIRVTQPHNCKNNCPACARHCPKGAIIFPKYAHSPINGGTTAEEDAVQIDTRGIYAQTFRERLVQRRKL